MKEIGTKIRKVRELKGFSQQYMASQLHMSQNNYSKIELGYVKIPMERIHKIAEILQIAPTKLFEFDVNQIFDSLAQPTNQPTNLKRKTVATYSNSFLKN